MQPKDGKNVACLAEMRKGTLSVCTAAALFVPLNLHMYFYMYLYSLLCIHIDVHSNKYARGTQRAAGKIHFFAFVLFMLLLLG